MRQIILVALLLSACQSLPGTAPTTIGQCLEQRGGGMIYTAGETHEFMYNSLTSCELEIAQRKTRESSSKQRN